MQDPRPQMAKAKTLKKWSKMQDPRPHMVKNQDRLGQDQNLKKNGLKTFITEWLTGKKITLTVFPLTSAGDSERSLSNRNPADLVKHFGSLLREVMRLKTSQSVRQVWASISGPVKLYSVASGSPPLQRFSEAVLSRS